MNQPIFPKLEEKILRFWQKNKIFEKSLAKTKRNKKFVFFEGPPTANGQPGIHHVLARSFKDLVCRYKTMQGFFVERKAGWDTHGLPVELEVEKKLGFKNKQDIEKYGIAKFNKKCKESVWTYKDEWENLTRRMGFWLDLKNPYITYDNKYIESLWWIIKKIADKKLLVKDYKVSPYCSRCGTALSSHELALGYKKIKEPSIYIKFKIKNLKFKIPKNTYFLVWTTTPWTLPGNVALAVHPEVDYVLIKAAGENLILAKPRLKVLEPLEYKVVKEFKGKNLKGWKYEPLYQMHQIQNSKFKIQNSTFKVVTADFVTIEDGSGIVHIAPAFGEDDMRVAKKNNLPVLMTVDETGKFKKEVKPWAGLFVKDADPLIIKELDSRRILFKKEDYEHDYPFCWRCNMPLLYYAKDSWFIKMTKPEIKSAVLKNNQKINWIPSHLKQGRFGEWLKDLRDWAFSRERYWGTPLPIWQCEKCHFKKVISSITELGNETPNSGNNYFIMRHGEADSNHKDIVSSYPEKVKRHLTEKGKKDVIRAAKKLKRMVGIDLIFASDISRTKETAEIIAKELGIKKINFDLRLREIDFGILNGKFVFEYHQYFGNDDFLRFEKRPPKGENLKDVKKRMIDFVKSLEKKYCGKNILIVSHGDPMWVLAGALDGLTNEEIVFVKKKLSLKPGNFAKLAVKNIPLNEDGDLDLHRPYIDEIKLNCPKCKSQMNRVKEVADVWFDSGAMPFSQWHWPFENKNFINKGQKFPADFIAEGMDQTRGWFYTLLAVSTLLGKGAPYKNVISHGLVLDAKGQKMSKSKGNVVSPWDMADKYGMDALRWYFFTVNQPGEPKRFNEKDILDKMRGIISTLWNSFIFYNTYAFKSKDIARLYNQSEDLQYFHILDKWILARLQEIIKEVSTRMDKYEIIESARALEDFILNDLSNWYIRRSRRRLQKPENKKEKEEASKILEYILFETLKLCAPFIPFVSEAIYQEIIKHKKSSLAESIHLCDFPKFEKKLLDKDVIDKMNTARKIVEFVLKLRAEAGLKVRQPLAILKLAGPKAELEQKILEIIADEINVKDIEYIAELCPEEEEQFKESDGIYYFLDTHLTPDLRMEGVFKDIIRNIQEMRKEMGLTPENKIEVCYSTDSAFGNWLQKREKTLAKEVLAKNVKRAKDEKHIFDMERTITIAVSDDGKKEEFWIGVKKI